jgi:cytochrome c
MSSNPLANQAGWLVVLCAFLSPLCLAQSPGLGQPVSAVEIQAIDFTIMPDGIGLPSGSGDAVRGATVYQAHCQSCHGEQGVGGLNDRLAGGHGSLTSNSPVKTVGSYWPYATTLFDYVRRAMPYTAPGNLTDDDLFAVTAYVLFVNGIVSETMVVDAKTLPGIKMPNADNFVWAVSSD